MIGTCHVAMSQREADPVDGNDSRDDSGARTDSDQRIHVRRTGKQGSESFGEIGGVDGDDGNRQQKLRKGENQCIFGTQKKAGQGKSRHMAHADIEKRYGEQDGNRQPGGHRLFFPVGRIGSRPVA